MQYASTNCFNPCFNGIWFKSGKYAELKYGISSVSILVLMEFGLKVQVEIIFISHNVSFNPCFNGIWFKSIVKS